MSVIGKFGGIVGLLVIDPATGAMWTLDTNEVNVSLAATKQDAAREGGNLQVVLWTTFRYLCATEWSKSHTRKGNFKEWD
jgi:hypothetical protein